jgi:hypothetical protein
MASDADADGGPAAGLCSWHQGHCMPVLVTGKSSGADVASSAPTLSAWIQNMPLTLHT